MTEAEWLSCADPYQMLFQLPGNPSERKVRLFCCACCRLVWEKLKEPEARRAIKLSEAFADDPAIEPELMAATKVVDDMNAEDWTNGFLGFPTRPDSGPFFT